MITIVLALSVSIVICELLFRTYRHIKLLQTSANEGVTFYVIGGSTAWGFPYDGRPGFALLVKDALRGKYKGHDITINMIAFSGKLLAPNVYDFKKDLFLNPPKNAIVLVYTGINEDISRKYQEEFCLENIFNKSIVGSILYNFYTKVAHNDSNDNNSLFLYESRLQDLISWAKYANHHVYLSELVGNFHDYEPHHLGANISVNQFGQLMKCEATNSSEKKVSCLEAFINQNGTGFESFRFYIAREEYRLNPTSKNLKTLDKFYQYDYSYRPIPEKNEVIRRVVNKNVTLIPTLQAFKEVNKGFLGYNLFVDVYHPNIQGMMIIANQFLHVLTGNKNVKTLPIEQIREKYRLGERGEDILRDTIRWFFFSGLSVAPFSFTQIRRLNHLLNIYDDYDFVGATVIKYLTYPILPLDPKKKSLNKVIRSFQAEELEKFKSRFHFTSVEIKKMLSYVERAKNRSLISKDMYQEYLAFITSLMP